MSKLEYELNFQANGADQVKGVASALKLLGTSPDFGWVRALGGEIDQASANFQKLKKSMSDLGAVGVLGGAATAAAAMVVGILSAARATSALRAELDQMALVRQRAFEDFNTDLGKLETKGQYSSAFRDANRKVEDQQAKVSQLEESAFSITSGGGILLDSASRGIGGGGFELASNDMLRLEQERATLEEFKRQRDVLFRRGKNAPVDADKAKADEASRFESELSDEQRRRGFGLRLATAGQGGVGAANRMAILQDEEGRLALDAKRIALNAGSAGLGGEELKQVNNQILAIERQRTSIMLQILREEENLAAAKSDYEKAKRDQERKTAKSTMKALDAEIRKTQDRRDQIAGMQTGLDVSNLTRIGISNGGEGAAAANYQRKMAEGVVRLVTQLDKVLANLEARQGEAAAVLGGD